MPAAMALSSSSIRRPPAVVTAAAFLFAAVWLGMSELDSPRTVVVVDAAHPRRRVAMRRQGAAYDREITTFTEDGRLAQVEYGLEASLRGSTVGAIRFGSDDDDDDDAESDDDAGGGDGASSLSSSCVVVCIEHSSFGKMHRIDDHLWMLTAGLSGDARMLADQARRACQNHRLRTGEAPTTLQAARSAAEFYHRLTRIGGCRPLGCSAIFVGVDAADGKAKLVRTDPGGGFEECGVCAAGNRHEAVGKELADLAAAAAAAAKTRLGDDDDDQRSAERHRAGAERGGKKKEGGVSEMASAVAGAILRRLEGNGKAPRKGKAEEPQQQQQQPGRTTLDVWTIQPADGRRGGMLAICYGDVRKDNFDRISSVHARK
eukprot:CAMPEP_0197188250 /NCGR_PEP_ID=MMETSP1423-20130617/17521_1 /TAXON_ID=476441 /ORGANISM="Pseudo-nitzschia heimii, Strain UNC1101" /LENGTH=373 /DNA_ID=CAMNT_0042640045 /DNA_START=122 /DNA_END=1243 /DNA_ORIENTATION=-